jgi:hypothetical protein
MKYCDQIKEDMVGGSCSLDSYHSFLGYNTIQSGRLVPTYTYMRAYFLHLQGKSFYLCGIYHETSFTHGFHAKWNKVSHCTFYSYFYS